jgi:hypothetical protein
MNETKKQESLDFFPMQERPSVKKLLAYELVPQKNQTLLSCVKTGSALKYLSLMTQDMINLITALGGVVSAVGAVAAAFAAYKSAASAQSAGRHAETVHRQGVIRDLIDSANGGIAEMTQINELIAQMKRGISDLQHGGGSPDKTVITKQETKQQALLPLREEAAKLIDDSAQLVKTSDTDLTKELIKMRGFLSQARQIKESLEKQVALIEVDVQFMRTRLK